VDSITVGCKPAVFLLIVVLGGLLIEFPVSEQPGRLLEQPVIECGQSVIECGLPKYFLLQYSDFIPNNVPPSFGTGLQFDQFGYLIVIKLPLLFNLEQLCFDASLYYLEVFTEQCLLHFLVN
jgi:hypothetical protein